MTNLLGRTARGKYEGVNPKYEESRGPQVNNRMSVTCTIEGEIVVVESDYAWILDAEGHLRRCHLGCVIVLPRDYQGPLR